MSMDAMARPARAERLVRAGGWTGEAPWQQTRDGEGFRWAKRTWSKKEAFRERDMNSPERLPLPIAAHVV